MSIRDLPGIPTARPYGGLQSQVMPRAFDRWNPGLHAAADDDESDRSISIYDVIGVEFWSGDGVTAKRIAGVLRALGKGPVTVNINSPGGDLFEGLAIYNLLREHPGEITVKVLGLAASAASVIAMAGDTIQIARAGFFMVHNTWAVAVGNRIDFREFADWLEPFDAAMTDIYASRSGLEAKEIGELMDAETWIGGASAIERGFADELLPSDQIERSGTGKAASAAVRRVEAALRASGMPKSEALKLISEFKAGVRDAPGAGGGDPVGERGVDPAHVRTAATTAANLTSLLRG